LLRAGVALVLVAVGLIPTGASDASVLHSEDSVYGHLEVRQGPGGRRLILGSPYSVQSIGGQGMERGRGGIFSAGPELSRLKPWRRSPREALILGLGAGSMVRPTKALHPGIEVHGVEIDGRVVELGRRWFDLELPEERVHVLDARAFVRGTDMRFDLVIPDAYKPPTIPYHLATVEFFGELRRVMTEDSLLLVDYSGLRHREGPSARLLSTVGAVFERVERFRLRSSVNSMIWACAGECTVDRSRLGPRWSAVRAPEEGGPAVLTDDRNPVELLQEVEMLRYALGAL